MKFGWFKSVAVAFLVVGCTSCASSQDLLVSELGEVEPGSTVSWHSGDTSVDIESFFLDSSNQLRGVQEFTVEDDVQVMLSSNEHTQPPPGVDLTWSIQQNDVEIYGGKLQSLLVQPQVIDLVPGEYVLEVNVEPALGYQDDTYAERVESFTLPRVKVEESVQ